MQEYKKYTYTTKWSPKDQCTIGTVKEFPSLKAHGDTPEEALAEIQQVVQEVLKEEFMPLPHYQVDLIKEALKNTPGVLGHSINPEQIKIYLDQNSSKANVPVSLLPKRVPVDYIVVGSIEASAEAGFK